MISLLVPTRGRYPFVEKMLYSIIQNAHSNENFEILFGIDNDDIETANKINNLLLDKNINYKIILFDRLYYKGFHLYLNELYKHSSGELIWTYPDDVEILTKDWDLILKQYENEMYLMVDLGYGWRDWSFSIIPIISKKWIETTCRFSENSQTDLWLGEIAKELNIITKVPVTCNVFYPANGSQHNISDFLSKKVQDEKKIDIQKLKTILKK